MADQNTNNRPITPEEYYDTVRVGDYYEKVHRTTWARRTSGFMAGATLGAAFGVLAGILVSALPFIFALPAIALAAPVTATFGALLAQNIPLFAAAAAFIGIAAVGTVGSDSGAIAAGLEEMEKRNKVEKAINGRSADLPSDTQKEKEKIPKLFSWKVAAITVPLTMALGTLVGFSPQLPHVLQDILGVALDKGGTALAAATSATAFGTYGTAIATKCSYLTNAVSNFYFKIITEQFFSKNPEQEKTVSPQTVVGKDNGRAVDYEVAQAMGEGKCFAAGEKRSVVRAILEKSAEQPAQELGR